jgi:hypothetical protein
MEVVTDNDLNGNVSTKVKRFQELAAMIMACKTKRF